MAPTLKVEHLTRRYGTRCALEDVSFQAECGEVIALLGPNGAGKSTLMNTLTGYIAMSEGQAFICGHDVQQEPLQARRLVGYLPEQPPLYPDMTVTEYLRYCAALKGIRHGAQHGEIDRVLSCTGLKDYARRLSGQLSKGYRQRLGVAQALLGAPRLLILDEPGSGLDPLQMTQMRDVIHKAGQESTVLLSSHMLSEVTNICGRALVLSEGHLRYDGSMAQLLRSGCCLQLLCRSTEESIGQLLSALEGFPEILRVTHQRTEDDCVTMRIEHQPGSDPRGLIARTVLASQAELLELSSGENGLEHAFLQLLQQREGDA